MYRCTSTDLDYNETVSSSYSGGVYSDYFCAIGVSSVFPSLYTLDGKGVKHGVNDLPITYSENKLGG